MDAFSQRTRDHHPEPEAQAGRPADWPRRDPSPENTRSYRRGALVVTEQSLQRLHTDYIEGTVERELIPMAAEMGLGVIPWSPLAGGC